MVSWGAIAAFWLAATPLPDYPRVIEGVVVNGSEHQAPVSGSVVVLRVDNHGELDAIAQTTTDGAGRFRFADLPVADNVVCLAGANHEGIHYPGVRIRLERRLRIPHQKIIVYETVSEPNPLVTTRHEIEIRADAGVLAVSETMTIANQTLRTYVGPETPADRPPVTLQVSIPPEFERVTFDKEFFGRQFHWNGRCLETQIPWTPGQRELKFTYWLPFESRYWLLRRPLDCPCERIRLRVVGSASQNVASNLPRVRAPEGVVVFESDGSILPAGFTIQTELGSLPVPWTVYARWSALAALFILIVLTGVVLRRRRRLKPIVPWSTKRWRPVSPAEATP